MGGCDQAKVVAKMASAEALQNAGLWDGDSGLRMHLLDGKGQPTPADGIVLSDTFTVTR